MDHNTATACVETHYPNTGTAYVRTAAVAVQVLEDILDGQSLLGGHGEDLGHALDDVRRVLRDAQEPNTKCVS
jgi:hypothetical protein